MWHSDALCASSVNPSSGFQYYTFKPWPHRPVANNLYVKWSFRCLIDNLLIIDIASLYPPDFSSYSRCYGCIQQNVGKPENEGNQNRFSPECVHSKMCESRLRLWNIGVLLKSRLEIKHVNVIIILPWVGWNHVSSVQYPIIPTFHATVTFIGHDNRWPEALTTMQKVCGTPVEIWNECHYLRFHDDYSVDVDVKRWPGLVLLNCFHC